MWYRKYASLSDDSRVKSAGMGNKFRVVNGSAVAMLDASTFSVETIWDGDPLIASVGVLTVISCNGDAAGDNRGDEPVDSVYVQL